MTWLEDGIANQRDKESESIHLTLLSILNRLPCPNPHEDWLVPSHQEQSAPSHVEYSPTDLTLGAYSPRSSKDQRWLGHEHLGLEWDRLSPAAPPLPEILL